MKLKPLMASMLLASSYWASAGEAVFYVTEDGAAVSNMAITVNGEKKLLKQNGFIVFDLAEGQQTVEISEYGEWLGDFNFTLDNDQQNAEINVEIIGGEAMFDVATYMPGSEEAAAVGQFAGILTSEETAGPVSDARISVNGTDIATTTNEDGAFVLEIPRGQYDLTVAHPNYGNRSLNNLHVLSGAATRVDLTMSLSGDELIEEVVAVGSYVPQSATTSERDASTVLDAIGAEQFARFGDSSAASALKRVSGVSISDGEFAVVRGLQGRYNSTTMNNGLIPSTDPIKREVSLDIFPASVLKTIEIKKGFSPELPGDSTGGSINLVTRGMPDEEYTQLKFGMAYVAGVTGDDIATYDGGDNSLGFDDGTRELPSAVDAATDFGRPDVFSVCSGSFCSPGSVSPEEASQLGKKFKNIYDVDEKTAGPDIEFSVANASLWELDQGELGVYSAFAYKNQWESRQDAEINDPREGNFTYQRSKQKIDLTGYLAVDFSDGNNDWSSKTTILRKSEDLTKLEKGVESADGKSLETAILQWTERQFIQQRFGGKHALGDGNQALDWHIAYAQSTRDQPDRRSYDYINGVAVNGPLERKFSEMEQNSLDARLDYSFQDYQWHDDLRSTFNIGVYFSAKDREVRVARFGFRKNDQTFSTTGITFEQAFVPENFDAGVWVLDVNTSPTDSYDGVDDTNAVYFSVLSTYKENLDIIFGARNESTTQEIKYIYSSADDASFETDELLPMIAATYRMLGDELQLRAGWSQTLSRPELVERSDTIFFDPDTDEEVSGSPSLEASFIDNFDLRLEYYLNDEDSISAGFFYKDIDSPVEKTVLPSCSGRSCDGYTFRNQESATILGLEIDGKLGYDINDNWAGFVGGNIALIDSEVTLSQESEFGEGQSKRELQGQSDVLANIQFGFDEFEHMQSFTLVANYFDDRIYKIERNGDDRIEDGRLTLDLLYKWDFTEDLSFGAKIENLTDEKVSYSRDGNVIESYRNGARFKADVSWKF
ncbi:MAG: TonB-dependent receptor [Pseudomonadales bacterium]|nr:TonB-dependent receptor [Pseudomonadales bacterium]